MIPRILFFLLLPWVAFGATPAYEKFKGAGTVTITTNPPNGDVTITGTGVSGGSSTNSSGTVAYTNMVWSRVRWVDSVAGTGTGIENDASKPWANPVLATNGITPGTVIRVRTGFYDLGSSNVYVFPGTGLIGDSEGTVFLSSTSPLFTNGPVVALGSTSVVENIRVIQSARHLWFQAAFGAVQGINAAFTNAVLRNISSEGDSDVFYVNRTAPCSGYLWNVNFTSKWDAFVLLDGAHFFEGRVGKIHCDLKGAQFPGSQVGGLARPVLLSGGAFLRLFDYDLIATNGPFSYGVELSTGGDVIEIHGGSIQTAGTNQAWHIYGDEDAVFRYWGNQTTLTNVSGGGGVPIGATWGGSSPYLVRGFYPAAGFKLFTDALTLPIHFTNGGIMVPSLSRFTNSIAIPGFGSTVGYKWTCTNATTGEGQWDDDLILSASESTWYIRAYDTATLAFSNTVHGLKMSFTPLDDSWNVFANLKLTGAMFAAGTATAPQYLTTYGTSDFIPTNNALSNLTINFIAGPAKRDLYITNNVTITNIVPPGLGTNGSITLRITPQLIPRGLLLPTLGGNQFGVKIHTNANNPVWTTLTNGVGYRLVMEAWGTNIDVAISEWK